MTWFSIPWRWSSGPTPPTPEEREVGRAIAAGVADAARATVPLDGDLAAAFDRAGSAQDRFLRSPHGKEDPKTGELKPGAVLGYLLAQRRKTARKWDLMERDRR